MVAKINLTFLGTADQIPSASRNHSAILLDYAGEHILVDCGEGTQRQFRKANLNPGKVTRILITHWHADHVLGLAGLLHTMGSSGYNKTLYIYGPKWTKQYMRDLMKLFGIKLDFEVKVEEVSGKFLDLDDFYLEAAAMQHGIPTNAYNFVKKGQLRIDRAKLKKSKLPQGPLLKKLAEGKDISFKGKKYKAKSLTYKDDDVKVSFVLDTKNNEKIAKFAKGANVFVCESSFDDELEKKASEHLHLTSGQAARIAKKAKVEKLILTHLSMRYEHNTKLILSQAKKVFKNVEVAKDLDVINVC